MVLHLITQRGQPYSSVRRCCERCGAWASLRDEGHTWTDCETTWLDAPEVYVRCDQRDEARYG